MSWLDPVLQTGSIYPIMHWKTSKMVRNTSETVKYFQNGSEMIRFLPQKTTFFRTQMILKLSGNPVIQSSISLGRYPTLQSYIKLSHCLRIFTTQSQHSHHPQYQLKKQRLNSNRVLVVRNLSLNQQSHQVVLNYMKFLQLGTLLKRLTSGLKSWSWNPEKPTTELQKALQTG